MTIESQLFAELWDEVSRDEEFRKQVLEKFKQKILDSVNEVTYPSLKEGAC